MTKATNGETIGFTQFLLLLQRVPHLGERTLTRLLSGSAQRRLSPEEILNLPAETLRKELMLDPRSAAYIAEHRTQLLLESANLARTLRGYPLQIVSVRGAAYPSRLERYTEAPPPVLCTLGNHSLLDETRDNTNLLRPPPFTFTVAVSRAASQASLTLLDEFATQLAVAGGIAVTGHDRQEYQRLALASQRRNLPVVYVFDRGLREALGPEFDRPPFAAARIRDIAFDVKRDLAISSFRLDDHCIGSNNKRRDSIVFALSDIVVALDITAAGGMYKECHKSLKQGKRVFAMRSGREGSRQLLTEGAIPVPVGAVWRDFFDGV